jgi:hypothetical protein
MSLLTVLLTTKVRPRPEGGGDFAPALGGGSGANRIASDPEKTSRNAVPGLTRDLPVNHEAPDQVRGGCCL